VLLEVESVTNNKNIGEFKSSIGNGHVNDAGDDPVKECADLQAGRIARLKGPSKVAECLREIFSSRLLFLGSKNILFVLFDVLGILKALHLPGDFWTIPALVTKTMRNRALPSIMRA